MNDADEQPNRAPAPWPASADATIVLGDRPLRLDDIRSVAEGAARAEYSPTAVDAIARAHDALLRLAETRPVYGLSTGVGARRSVAVVRDRESCLRLWRSHALQFGPAVDGGRVRAMLLVRANQLAQGGSGVSPALADALLAATTREDPPSVSFGGALGTGDLGALATVALQITSDDSTGTFAASDGLPFMSSSALTLADAALTLADLDRAIDAATVLGAAAVRALGTTAEHFATAAFADRYAAMRDTATRLAPSGDVTGPRVQDPFSMRLLPQSLGSVRLSWEHCRDATLAEVNSAHENPRVFTQEQQIAHTGNFYTVDLELACGTVLRALAQDSSLMLARLGLLMDPRYTGQAEFLGDGTPDATGAMMLEYVAAAALADIRDLAAAHGGHGVHLSLGAEEHAPFTPQAVRRLRHATDGYRTMLACFAVALRRLPGMDDQLLGLPESHGGLEDRDLSHELAETASLLDSIRLGESHE
ncbi:aromatic amino acid ammonia-lyase [Microbacterium sp. Au-Mic1]|uniref:aromatic amino acid lyase n=1 Tax=Microbacterium sp. Au-Mic1 TaxID=2906457 RepID=UPI001E396858|nr:aromatic amino acid lyase [Microbacterium sp. Au-Mic1]MCE4025125.1 aromatic amino acid ammonia-lyase [Microbacterium sp. Au-Mic1]